MAVVTIDSYSESNFTGYYWLKSGIPYCGQSFTGDGRVLDSVKLYLAKSGSPVLDCYARIYSHTGTYGTSSEPDTLLSTSGAIDASTLGTDPTLVEFTFSGENKITLADGTYYVLVLYYNTTSTTHVVGCGADNSSPTHSGNAGYEFIPSYEPASGVDLCFYVYGDKITPAIGEKYALPPFSKA